LQRPDKEVSDLFDKPRFFHLGMDEENAEDQKWLNHVVIRQHDLWWHDFYFFVDQVEKNGSRAGYGRITYGKTRISFLRKCLNQSSRATGIMKKALMRN
jgi:hypothetical protein